MTTRMIASVVGSLVVLGCGGGNGGEGGDGGNNQCEDVLTTPQSYNGQETVVGCYFPGTYTITATVTHTKGTCDATFAWQSTTGALHSCSGTFSGNSTSGYAIDFSKCSLPGTIHITPDLSTFTGSFNWTVSCGSGTTTFQNMAKK